MKLAKDGVELTARESQMFGEALETVKSRLEMAGVDYNDKLDESVRYCLYGALYTGGIPGMMRYALETPIKPKGARV